MCVREHDRARIYAFQFSQPIKTAINHHVCSAMRNQQGGVHAVPSGARVDFTACAEKRQRHWEKLAFFLSGRDSLGVQRTARPTVARIPIW